MNQRMPRWIPIALVAIPLLSVPWCWPQGAIRPFVLGMPSWAAFSFAMSALFAAVTAWAILRHWPDEDSAAGDDGADGAGRAP